MYSQQYSVIYLFVTPKAQASLTPGKRATAVCVCEDAFAISTLFDAP